MNSRERVLNTFNRDPVDRIPIYDSFWKDTQAEFREQGIPDGIALEDYFDFDFRMYWFEQSFLLDEEILEEKDGKRTYRDSWGATNVIFLEKQTSPGLLDFAVRSRTEWEDHYKELLTYHPDRIPWERLREQVAAFRQQDRYTVLSMLDPFECGWHMVGPEEQLKLLIKDPEWLADIYDSCTRLIEDAWGDLQKHDIQPDGLWLYGDIAYKNGPMFSPDHYRKILQPFHARLVDLAHNAGSQVIYHSDGDITKLIPLLKDTGVDCLHPLEVKAGMDVREIKPDHGKDLTLMGNIDARLFAANDLAGLEGEIRSKIPPAMAGGGYIYHSDHSIPPGTTLDTYQFALDVVRDIGKYA